MPNIHVRDIRVCNIDVITYVTFTYNARKTTGDTLYPRLQLLFLIGGMFYVSEAVSKELYT